jgi:hypothetical protein
MKSRPRYKVERPLWISKAVAGCWTIMRVAIRPSGTALSGARPPSTTVVVARSQRAAAIRRMRCALGYARGCFHDDVGHTWRAHRDPMGPGGGWKPYAYIKPAFQRSFSRAVRSLIKRGLLRLKEEEKVVSVHRLTFRNCPLKKGGAHQRGVPMEERMLKLFAYGHLRIRRQRHAAQHAAVSGRQSAAQPPPRRGIGGARAG